MSRRTLLAAAAALMTRPVPGDETAAGAGAALTRWIGTEEAHCRASVKGRPWS